MRGILLGEGEGRRGKGGGGRGEGGRGTAESSSRGNSGASGHALHTQSKSLCNRGVRARARRRH